MQGYKSVTQAVAAKERPLVTFDHLDANHDGVITRDEFNLYVSGQVALRISNYTGVHADQVNGAYEPLGKTFNGKPCWGARLTLGTAYIYHTGHGRWVINKRLDQDGSRCYAFLADDAGDPSTCRGKWTLFGPEGQWREEPRMTCTREHTSPRMPSAPRELSPARMSPNEFSPPRSPYEQSPHRTISPYEQSPQRRMPTRTVSPYDQAQPVYDIFNQMREKAEKDLRDFGLTDSAKMKQLWRALDKNGNNEVSLAEIQCFVEDMTKSKTWPTWVNNKQALQRAFEKTTKADANNNDDDWIEKNEFHALLSNIFWFAHVHEMFYDVDSNSDKKIDMGELKAGLSKVGCHLTDQEAIGIFNDIDSNHNGTILFTEFCLYVRKRTVPYHVTDFDKDTHFNEVAGQQVMRKSEHGDQGTSGHFVQKKNLGAFDELEKKIRSHFKDMQYLRKLWRCVDFNGNNIVSLAEIDKMVVEHYPLLNHKPALMRAYKATIATKHETDEFVHQRDFKCLLINLFYFNKLFWLFDHVDEDRDRRLTAQEFKWCLSIAGCKMSDAKAQTEFKKVDKNGGGKILFDEFCKYFTEKQCPDVMTQFVG